MHPTHMTSYVKKYFMIRRNTNRVSSCEHDWLDMETTITLSRKNRIQCRVSGSTTALLALVFFREKLAARRATAILVASKVQLATFTNNFERSKGQGRGPRRRMWVACDGGGPIAAKWCRLREGNSAVVINLKSKRSENIQVQYLEVLSGMFCLQVLYTRNCSVVSNSFRPLLLVKRCSVSFEKKRPASQRPARLRSFLSLVKKKRGRFCARTSWGWRLDWTRPHSVRGDWSRVRSQRSISASFARVSEPLRALILLNPVSATMPYLYR